MSVQNRIGSAAAPDWLKKIWNGARQRELDTLTRSDVDAEIDAHRRTHDPSRQR